MSAIRSTDRRAARSLNSSPYASARQVPKKSSWTLGIGGLLSYINPLRSRSSGRSVNEQKATSDSEEIEGKDIAESDSAPYPINTMMRSPSDSSASSSPQIVHNPAVALPVKDHQQLVDSPNGTQQTPVRAQHNTNLIFSTPPRVATNSPPNDANLSPAESLEKVQKFLREKNGQALSEWETRGLLMFLEKNVQNDNEKAEPFRFLSTPSRSPARGNSPVFVFGTPGISPASNGDGTSPRRTLSKNPNGVYRWQGGGSAKPRNRYQSPSFGTRSPPPTIRLSPAKTDAKRRRLGEDVDARQVPFPAVSPQKPMTAFSHAPTPAPSQSLPIFPTANGNTTTPNGEASSSFKTNGAATPRLRTSGLPTKPTAPSVPSPLRQTWGHGDSPPHSTASKPNGTPTKAANFMTELIKDVTPPNKPDVANPYQTASPVKPRTRKPMVKRSRASAKSVAPPVPVKAPEPSPQAIIEATMPKGSKRSRPPPDLAKSRSDFTFASAPRQRSPETYTPESLSVNGVNGAPNAVAGLQSSSVVVEEVIDDDEDDRLAKKQKTTPEELSTFQAKETDDVDMPLTPNPTTSKLSPPPTEVTESDENAGSLNSDQSAGPINSFVQSTIGASPVKSAFGLKSSAPKEPSKLRFSYKGDTSPPLAAATPAMSSPPLAPRMSHARLPDVVPTMSQTVEIAGPKQAVIAMTVHDLPTYSFPEPALSVRFGADYFASAQEAAKAVPRSSLPTFTFSTPSDLGRTTLSESGIGIPPTPTVKAFDWAAAGMKAPSAAGGKWTCSTCMLSNPATATKCTVCDASR